MNAPVDVRPSGWKIEQALSAWQSARARLLQEDTSLEGDEAALIALLGPEEGDIRDILARLLRAAVHAEDMSDVAAARAKAISERAARYKRRCEGMRATAFAIMDAMGLRRDEWPDMTVSISAGRIGVVITDEAAIPDQFVKITREPKKKDLLDELKSREALRQSLLSLAATGGFEVDPATLPPPIPGAELSNGMPSLQIRTR